MLKKTNHNVLCWCGSGKKYRKCHAEFDKKIEYYRKKDHIVPSKDMIKTEAQISGIRESGKINNTVLDYVAERIGVGMTTEAIDRLVYEKTTELHGIPAPLGFEGFPKSVCTSINDQICHGIPSDEVSLKEGDIINVDVSTIYKGYFSDASRMFCIGKVSPEKDRLVRTVKECIKKGLEKVKPWGFLGDMGQAIWDHARTQGYTVVREVGGHGVGLEFHEDPWVSFTAKKGTEMLMAPGMVFTIEPMLNEGTREIVIDEKNGWTIYTKDGKSSAQWEVTVAITKDGYEILAH